MRRDKSYKQSCVSTGKGSFKYFMDQLPSFSDIDYINGCYEIIIVSKDQETIVLRLIKLTEVFPDMMAYDGKNS